jgi:putative ABC transport system substrate-binding protein
MTEPPSPLRMLLSRHTRRREFITLLGGAAAAWPLAVRAQPDRVPRVGVLVAWGEDDREAKANLSEFTHGLQQLGWIDGRNIRMEIRWASGSVERMRTFAKELVYMQPAVILSVTTSPTTILQQETRTIPIVFVIVSDPVGTGVVASLAKPGANLTGFVYAEGEIGGKWLQLLKEIAPGVKRAAIMFNPNTAPGGGSYHLPSFDTAARSLNVEPITAAVHSDAEIEASIASLGREPGGGLVVMADSFMWSRRARAISLAARNKIPDIYPAADAARDGCLLSYGPDFRDVFRRAAPYVDRILRGANPADLPVQVPTKFELAINLKTARSLGLDVPLHLQQLADEVIE